jgi:hypothetical protein
MTHPSGGYRFLPLGVPDGDFARLGAAAGKAGGKPVDVSVDKMGTKFGMGMARLWIEAWDYR